ncbi:MAG: amidohydrolase family protein [Deltaproteobacteria bacterium]|nr:amidohydrolase family protein [Deltaproteobacteria bacterium]
MRTDSLLIRGGTLLHLDTPRVERADVLITDGIITAVGTDLPVPAKVIDADGAWVLPGLTVGHHHLYSALATGMPFLEAPATDFSDMLAKVWWRLDEALDEPSLRASALAGGIGALRAGVTTVVDHHASPNFIGGSLETLDGALDEVGLRRVLCYEVTDRGGPARAAAGLAAHEGLLGRATDGFSAVMIGAHANFTLEDHTLARVGAMAREAGVGVHIHVGEAVGDRALTGEPLVARMRRLGALVPGSVLAHGVHLSPDELAMVADAGAWLTHQPRSNMNNAVGYAKLAAFPQRTALGTDGIGADLFSELQAGWFRASEGGVGWFPSRWLELLHQSSVMAGDKLGLQLGALRPGAAGDLSILDPIPGPPLTGDNLAAAFIFRLTAAAVRHVVTGGVQVLADRMPTRVDAGEVDALAQRQAAALWGRMSDRPAQDLTRR